MEDGNERYSPELNEEAVGYESYQQRESGEVFPDNPLEEYRDMYFVHGNGD